MVFIDVFSYSISACIIGITIFGLYLFRPQEREYLWFAIQLMATALDGALIVSKELFAFPRSPYLRPPRRNAHCLRPGRISTLSLESPSGFAVE